MRPISILTYHSLDTSGSVISVSPQVFADQMDGLADLGYRGISLREGVAHRLSHGCWPDRAVVLTFDDGYANFYESAFPVLRRHGFSGTVFVVSGHMGGYNDWDLPPARLGTRAILSWRQAKELCAGNIEIGAHTSTHPNLCRRGREEAEREIATSRTEIEQHLGCAVSSFAYPYGGMNEPSLKIVKRQFQAACTTVLQRAGNDALHTLPRIDMYYIRSRPSLESLLEGRLDSYLRVRRFARAARHLLLSN